MNNSAKEEIQHNQRGRNRCRIHGDHNGGVLRKAQTEEVRRDDIHQVRNNERQAGRICNKSCSHDKGQCRALAEPSAISIAITIGVRISAAPSLANNASTAAPSKTFQVNSALGRNFVVDRVFSHQHCIE